MQIEIRGDKVIIDGYVNAVGRDSRPIRCQTGDFVEQVEPGVFRKALLRAKNVDLLLNHRQDRKLGSTEDGVLTLTEDNIGLRAHAEIGDEEAIEKARNKLLRGWSFGMYVNQDKMEQRSNDIPRRHLEDIDIFEVSLIDNTMMPYYAGTSVECRAEGEDALLETRAFDDTVEVNEVIPDDYYSEREKQLEQLRAESQWIDAEKRMQELRYNPYHDPTNGRFTSSSGGNGGYLFVGKGQKGKGMYVVDNEKFNNKSKGIDDYLASKSPMQAAKIRNTLQNRYNYGKDIGIISEQEFVETAINNKSEIFEKTSLKSKYNNLNNTLSTPQGIANFALKEGIIPKNRHLDFIRGNYTTDELNALKEYSKTKNASILPEKYTSKEYGISTSQNTGKGTYIPISKTAYEYGKYLYSLEKRAFDNEESG